MKGDKKMIRVVEDCISINSPDIDYVYEDFSHEFTIIDIKNDNGTNYLLDHHIRIYDIEDVYDIDDLNKIISDLEQRIEYTTDEDDIRSDMHIIKLIRDYISIYGDLYK